MALIILPTQLFDKRTLGRCLKGLKIEKIILWEHPKYFTAYKFNKKKLLLHRASMKYYSDYLGNKYQFSYYEFNKKFKLPKSYYLFDPVDKIKFTGKPIILENPNFL